jgi:hypothetical protein
MAKVHRRDQPLSPSQQTYLITQAIPGKIQLIRSCLSSRPVQHAQLTAAAIHSRAIASFLGIGFYCGKLAPDQDYHDHGGNRSWEVKVTDIDGGAFVDIKKILPEVRRILEAGFDSTNREFAHLTYWNDPDNQTKSGAPREDYRVKLESRITGFALAVIELFECGTKNLKV